MNDIATLVDGFVTHLVALTERHAIELARSSVESALGGRRAGPVGSLFHPAANNGRKRRPKQLCPVPGCKNPAAPAFGMVCAEHKSLPKARIKKYRQARRAAKLGMKTKRAPVRTKRKRSSPARQLKVAARNAKTRSPKSPAARPKTLKRSRPSVTSTATLPTAVAPTAPTAAT
jgi:hypothetical protein